MSSLLARIMLAIFMLPLGALVYMFVMFWIWEMRTTLGYYDFERAFVFGGVAAWAFVAVYWYLLWRRSIVWNTRRRVGTSVAAACAGAIGVIVGLACYPINERVGCFMGSVAAPSLWLVGTVFVWRESAAERAARLKGSDALVCPTCGYNLTGLSEPRCPECGSRFTLDELLRAQPGRAGAEIERAA
jgi:hypothetical protein